MTVNGRKDEETAMSDHRDPRGTRRGHAVSGVEHMPTQQELAADDRFLDALAAGRRDVCGAGVYGTDSYLASLISDARIAADAELPPLPDIDPAVAMPARDVVDVEVVATEDDVEADAAVGDGAAEDGSGTADDASGTVGAGPAAWWRPSRIGSALIGAAASLVLVAGGLSAVHSATPGSSLWPARVSLFGDRSVELELASTLDEADAAGKAGDAERARELLEHAERLLAEVEENDRPALESQMRETVERVRTVTRAPETVTNERTTTHRETRTLEPGVVTHTEVRTETVTETVTSTVGQGASGAPEETVGPPLVNEQPTLPTADPETVRSALPQIPGQ